MKRFYIIIAIVTLTLHSYAQNWDYIQMSGEYYFGEGEADSEVEADQIALADLCSKISTHVSSDFRSTYNQITKNQNISDEEFVYQCLKTYTSSTLTNCEKDVLEAKGKKIVRRWMKRSELSRIYESRISKAKDMVEMAAEALERNKVGLALQYYYWAYSLICSIQYPDEVKDAEGHVLVAWIKTKMRYILGDIKVKTECRDGDNVDLLFFYKGTPVSELEFNYSDGRETCVGKVKDGRGTMQMIPDFDGEIYHLSIEYEYKGLSRGDSEMESVLNVIGKAILPEAGHKLSSHIKAILKNENSAQSTSGNDMHKNTIEKVLDAIRSNRHTDAYSCFTLDGREMFDNLVGYGKGRIVGEPNISYYTNHNGEVVARGLQMSFSFRNGTKTTFVEDMVFTFDNKGKIKNVTFGLGKDAESDILVKRVKWKKEMREDLMEFLENYKTAYCLKRLDYIRNIFADDAIIIVGNVAKVHTQHRDGDGNMTLKGKDIITTNRFTKDEYLKRLEHCFMKNEFINIRFARSDVQKLEKPGLENIVCVQLAQDYNSSSYADMGYLFLMIDMENANNPFIKVRTWQPNEIDIRKVYGPGDFYDE